jgi:curved DNA-binding protein CbpA
MTENTGTNYYAVLGVDSEATIEQIEAAYFELARKLHPDVAGGGSEASERFMLINEAFQTLSDPDTRREYDESLSGGGPGVKSGEAVAEARGQQGMQSMDRELKRLTRTADRLIREGDFWRATELLQKALIKYPRQPELRRALAKAAASRHRYREAAEHLKVACEVEYFNADNHTLLGNMYAKGEQWDRALASYRDALSWNEEHAGAKKGIEEIEKILDRKKPFFKRLPGLLNMKLGRKD